MNHDKAWRHTCKVFLISLFWEALDIRALMCQVTCQIVTKLFLEDNGIWSLILVSNIFFSLNNVKGVLCSHQEAVLLDLWQLLHLSCSSSNAFFCLNYYYQAGARYWRAPLLFKLFCLSATWEGTLYYLIWCLTNRNTFEMFS